MITLTPSKETLKIECAGRIVSLLNMSLDRIVIDYNRNMDLVWGNSDLTPQEICDVLGTQASKLFIIGGATVDLIATISPETLSKLAVPKKKFTINENGTVTIENEDY